MREGVQNETINLLKSNTTYYFKVRGQIGCMPGDWSNIMKVETNNYTYYKNFSPSIFLPSIQKSSVPSSDVLGASINAFPQKNPEPINAVVKQVVHKQQTQKQSNKCFLWMCW